jgi:light-harvesting complex 1 beta chain
MIAARRDLSRTPRFGEIRRLEADPWLSRQAFPGLTEQQAKEFHEQFKITYSAFVGIAALVHLFVIAANPWF